MMDEASESVDSPQRNLKIWFKYFEEPMGWAEKYTVNSRNILNVGLAAFVLAFIMFGMSLSRFDFAFTPLPNDYLTKLRQVDGVYVAISGGNSSTPRACIEDKERKTQLVCTSFPGMLHTRMSGKEASAWLDISNDMGVVRLVVEGEEILNPKIVQEHLQDGIWKFFYLMAVFVVFFFIAVCRQRLLLSRKNPESPA